MARVSFSIPKAPKPGYGPRILFTHDGGLRLSYDKATASAMAQDAMPSGLARQAHDNMSVGGPEEPEANPVAVLIKLLNARLDEEDAQTARDLIAQFVDLPPEVQNGDQMQAQDSAVTSHSEALRECERRFGRNFSRLKSGW